MTFTQSNDETISQAVKAMQALDVDEQLGLFYFVYKEMGSSPAAQEQVLLGLIWFV